MAYVIGNDCVACGTCIDECPVGAISEGDIYEINPDECTECGTCASVCPNEAISLADYVLISIHQNKYIAHPISGWAFSL